MARRLEGKVCIVTGANQGIGLATSHALATRGATLWMVCRNPERGGEAVQTVRTQSGNQDVHLKVEMLGDLWFSILPSDTADLNMK